MAQRKQKQLDGENARSVAQKARRASELKSVSEMADANLNPVAGWRTVLPEHIEAIKTRLIGGDTLGNVCRALGLDRANVLRHFHENPELLGEHLRWRATGAHALYDNLIDMIHDKTMSASDKMFAYKVISNYAPKINKEVYSDQLQVKQDVTVKAPQMPDWFFGNVIDGELSQDSDPTI